MELKVTIKSSTIDEVKEIVKHLLDLEKEHSPHCTLSVNVEIN